MSPPLVAATASGAPAEEGAEVQEGFDLQEGHGAEEEEAFELSEAQEAEDAEGEGEEVNPNGALSPLTGGIYGIDPLDLSISAFISGRGSQDLEFRISRGRSPGTARPALGSTHRMPGPCEKGRKAIEKGRGWAQNGCETRRFEAFRGVARRRNGLERSADTMTMPLAYEALNLGDEEAPQEAPRRARSWPRGISA